jgi:hypothetical protein
MGSPLDPVMANFYMKHLEQQSLNTAPQKPAYWHRYVDDTRVVWAHGKE